MAKKAEPTKELSVTEQKIVAFVHLHGMTHACLHFGMKERDIQKLMDRAARK